MAMTEVWSTTLRRSITIERGRKQQRMSEPKSIAFRPEDLERLRESVDFFSSLYKLLHDGGDVVIPDTTLAALMRPASAICLRLWSKSKINSMVKGVKDGSADSRSYCSVGCSLNPQ